MGLPSHHMVGHSAPVRGRDLAGDGRRGQVSREVGQGRRLQLQHCGVFERGGHLENELAAVWCVHVKIAFALPGEWTQCPLNSPVRREDLARSGGGDVRKGMGQDRHQMQDED